MILLLPPPPYIFLVKKYSGYFLVKLPPRPHEEIVIFVGALRTQFCFEKFRACSLPSEISGHGPAHHKCFLKGHSFESTIVAYLSEELWGKNKNAKQAFIFIFKFLIKASIRQQHFFASLKSGAVTLAFHGGIKQKVSKNSLTNSCYC